MQLPEELLDFGFGKIAEPPIRSCLDRRQPPAAARPRNHDAGTAAAIGNPPECRLKRAEIVAVDRGGSATERGELRLEWLQGNKILGTKVGLEFVSVDDHDEIVEVVGSSYEERLPVRSLVELAVTRHDHDTVPQFFYLEV